MKCFGVGCLDVYRYVQNTFGNHLDDFYFNFIILKIMYSYNLLNAAISVKFKLKQLRIIDTTP